MRRCLKAAGPTEHHLACFAPGHHGPPSSTAVSLFPAIHHALTTPLDQSLPPPPESPLRRPARPPLSGTRPRRVSRGRTPPAGCCSRSPAGSGHPSPPQRMSSEGGTGRQRLCGPQLPLLLIAGPSRACRTPAHASTRCAQAAGRPGSPSAREIGPACGPPSSGIAATTGCEQKGRPSSPGHPAPPRPPPTPAAEPIPARPSRAPASSPHPPCWGTSHRPTSARSLLPQLSTRACPQGSQGSLGRCSGTASRPVRVDRDKLPYVNGNPIRALVSLGQHRQRREQCHRSAAIPQRQLRERSFPGARRTHHVADRTIDWGSGITPRLCTSSNGDHREGVTPQSIRHDNRNSNHTLRQPTSTMSSSQIGHPLGSPAGETPNQIPAQQTNMTSGSGGRAPTPPDRQGREGAPHPIHGHAVRPDTPHHNSSGRQARTHAPRLLRQEQT